MQIKCRFLSIGRALLCIKISLNKRVASCLGDTLNGLWLKLVTSEIKDASKCLVLKNVFYCLQYS